ncbi:hypothetical protein M8J77_011284 [Diaphorina citri]|nr:hypothetical protein M8J77_011284 [Diaphorina citri]
MDRRLMCLLLVALVLIAANVGRVRAGVQIEEKEKLRRFRLYKFQYDANTKKRSRGPNKNLGTKSSTPRRLHFFETTRTDLLDWFRDCPVCIDNGNGSFYRQRMSELECEAMNISKPLFDKTYILKELGDKLAPSGRPQSRPLYLTGYRFLSDPRNIDMIVKFFDIEVDKDGNELPLHQKLNKKLFAGGFVMVNNTQKRLKPLFVSETYLWEYQGTLPVVVLNFNNFKGTTYEAIRQEIAIEIRKIFVKYAYLFQRHTLSKRAQNNYEIYSSGDVTHDELYNAILFIMRSIHKKYRRQIIFILNDGEDSIIVNYKSSINYLISDSFANLKLQLLHKYANIVRRNLNLNDTEDGGQSRGDRLEWGGDEYKKPYITGRTTIDKALARKYLSRSIIKLNRAERAKFKVKKEYSHKREKGFNLFAPDRDEFGLHDWNNLY